MSSSPAQPNDFLAAHLKLLTDSHELLTGRPLISLQSSQKDIAEAIFNADFVVLSSGTEPDPLFNYANRTALTLFELDWNSLIALPARESAETALQSTRAKLMRQVIETGFIEGYSGIRISASGRRFMIEGATIWNVVAEDGTYHGQAATFSQWRDV